MNTTHKNKYTSLKLSVFTLCVFLLTLFLSTTIKADDIEITIESSEEAVIENSAITLETILDIPLIDSFTVTPTIEQFVDISSSTETIIDTVHTTTTTSETINSSSTLITEAVEFIESVVAVNVDAISEFINATSTDKEENLAPILFGEQDTETGKLVTVSSPTEDPENPHTNVLASTTIPEIYKVGEEDKIQIKWKNNGEREMSFNAYDTDNDNKLDYVEWTIPHLSTQIFEIIFISKAFHLDTDQSIIADVYEELKTQDNTYVSFTNNQYIRVTFEKILNKNKDITVYAKPTDSNNSASFEVYPVYEDENGNLTTGSKIATFPSISTEGRYQILLTELQTPTDRFDLKVSGNIDVDLVIDPSLGTLYWKNLTGNGSWGDENNWFEDSAATIPASDIPWAADNIYKEYNLELSNDAFLNSETPYINIDIGNGFIITGENNIAGMTNGSTIYGGTFTGDNFINNNFINGGSFTGSDFTNSSNINRGTFTGSNFTNTSSIYGGTFTGSSFANSSNIYGGTFTGSSFTNNNSIYGGTFTGSNFTNNGYIYGGTWAESYTQGGDTYGPHANPGFSHQITLLNLDQRLYWKNISGDISWNSPLNWFTDKEASIQADNAPWVDGVDTTYLAYNLSIAEGETGHPTIDTAIGTDVTGSSDMFLYNVGSNSSITIINGGTFTGSSFDSSGIINGGTFTGSYFINNSGIINGGTFTGDYFTNNSSINGGIFTGSSFTNNNTIYGGTFTGENFTNNSNIYGVNWALSYTQGGDTFGPYTNPLVGFANEIVIINLDLKIYDSQAIGGSAIDIDSCGTIVTNGIYNLTQNLTPPVSGACITIVENLTDVTINGANIDLSDITIDGAGGSGDSSIVSNSTLKLNYTGLTTNTSTYFNNIGELIINGSSHIDSSGNSTTCDNSIAVGVGCAWNGVFHPLIFYFNNAAGDGDWNNVLNWWNDVDFTVQATFIPTGIDQVFIHGEITQNTGDPAVALTLTLNGTSTNAIDINVGGNAVFNDSSSNSGNITLGGDTTFNGSSSNTGSIDSATSTFFGDLTSTVGGTVIGFVQRIFPTSATFIGNLNQGGRDDWTIISRGVNTIVDLSGAIYDLATNIFKGLLGGIFVSNSSINGGDPVVPTVTIISPIAKTIGDTIKWLPNIDWGTAVSCEYSYDNYVTMNTLDCSLDGSDLPRWIRLATSYRW